MLRLEKMDPNLYKAAMKGNMELLSSIVEANDPPAPNLTMCLTPQKNTVLHIAVEFGRQNIVEKVIQLWPSLISQHNSKGDTPLHVAARAGNLDLTKLLTPALNLNLTEGNFVLEDGNPVRQAGSQALRKRNLEGSNPIHEALKKSHGKVSLHLLAFEERHALAHEVNVAGESLLYLAAEAGLNKVVQKIIVSGNYSTQGPDGQNPLHIAVIKGQFGVVKILLDKASNLIPQVDGCGNTVLHYASAKSYCRVLEDDDKDEYMKRYRSKNRKQKEILKLLLEANPSLAYVPNRNGDYPLFFAIRNDFDLAVDTILDHCPDSAEQVNHKGQNALHIAVMEKNRWIIYRLKRSSVLNRLINEPDNDGNTPMHLATFADQHDIVESLIGCRPFDLTKSNIDLTKSNKEGLTAMDICGYTETEHRIRDTLRRSGAVPWRHRWQERFPAPMPRAREAKKISPELKEAIKTLPVVTVLVASIAFAAAFTVPGGYNRDGLPALMRNTALQVFLFSDILAFCSSMVATIFLVYANANSEDAFTVYWVLQTCCCFSGVAILAIITAFVTAVCVLTSKEKEGMWLAKASILLGSAVPIYLFLYKCHLEIRKWAYGKWADFSFDFAHRIDV